MRACMLFLLLSVSVVASGAEAPAARPPAAGVDLNLGGQDPQSDAPAITIKKRVPAKPPAPAAPGPDRWTVIPSCGGDPISAWLFTAPVADRAAVARPVLLPGPAPLPLENGTWVVRVEGGARRWPWSRPVSITHPPQVVEAELTWFWPETVRARWLPVDLSAPGLSSETAATALDASDVGLAAFAAPVPDSIPAQCLRRTKRLFQQEGMVITVDVPQSPRMETGTTMPEYLQAQEGALRIWHTGARVSSAGLVFATVAGPLYDALALVDEGDIAIWVALLNQGYPIRAVGDFPHPDDRPAVGGYLNRPDEATSAATLLAAIHAGRLVVSNGPLGVLWINGLGGGSAVPAGDASRQEAIIEAISSTRDGDRIERVELVYNGRVVKSWRGQGEQRILRVETRLQLDEPGWILVRYVSAAPGIWSISNPVFVRTAAFRSPPVPVTAVTLNAVAGGAGIPCTVRVWNGALYLGAHEVPVTGLRLELPPTAMLEATSGGGAVNRMTLYEATGAAGWTRAQAARPDLARLLTDPATYETMRRMLSQCSITFRF